MSNFANSKCLRPLATSLLALSLVISTGSFAADAADMKRVARLIETNYFESATALLEENRGKVDSNPQIELMLGSVYARKAVVYRVFSRSAIQTQVRYLRTLISKQRGIDRSRYVYLYYGEALLAAGQAKQAIKYLTRFRGQTGITLQYKQIADIRIARAKHMLGDKAGAKTMLAAVRTSDFLVQSELAAASADTGWGNLAPEKSIDRIIAKYRGKTMPMRVLSNALVVYVKTHQVQQGLLLIAEKNLAAASYEEHRGRSRTKSLKSAKEIRFYDIELIGALAALYQQAAELQLGKMAEHPQMRDAARYFLAESLMRAGKHRRAISYIQAAQASNSLGAGYKARLAIMDAAAEYLTGKRASAQKKIDALARDYENQKKIVLVADVLIYCMEIGAKCGTSLGAAKRLAYLGDNTSTRRANFAVGLYYHLRNKGQHDLAIRYLEAARDKSNKNKIDTNDPVLLVSLADLYMQTKSFSENLEIYFELSNEFPALRQLQEAGQGIYSMEFKSAGDVKIF